VLHCPSSNLKLGSGIADIPRYLSRGISVSLGADGAPCNNNLNMFWEMRLAALIQKPIHGPTAMNAWDVLRLATLGGAEALGIDQETGSLEAGKRADLVLLDLTKLWNGPECGRTEQLAAEIVFSCGPENVHSVMVDGSWLYRDFHHTTLDTDRILIDARSELRSLLERTPLT
jgi:cytosine/adenosine deaminase-related metal-dependent hydrolase